MQLNVHAGMCSVGFLLKVSSTDGGLSVVYAFVCLFVCVWGGGEALTILHKCSLTEWTELKMMKKGF